MTVTDLQAVRAASLSASRGNPEGAGAEQAAKNREIAKVVQEINSRGSLGANNELRFSFDRASGQPLVKIVDRVTNEVITQFPPESALRLAEFFRNIKPGERIA